MFHNLFRKKKPNSDNTHKTTIKNETITKSNKNAELNNENNSNKLNNNNEQSNKGQNEQNDNGKNEQNNNENNEQSNNGNAVTDIKLVKEKRNLRDVYNKAIEDVKKITTVKTVRRFNKN